MFFILLCLFILTAAPVRAFEMRQGDTITISKDSVVNGSLMATGNSVSVDGTVNGDLFCAGQTITISGTVSGDVLCAAQTLDIRGTVDGNVRSVGQLVDITGTVTRNVDVAGQTVRLDGQIGRELIAAGQTINVNGGVSGDVTAFSQTVSLGENAKLSGNLFYTSPVEISQSSGAAVAGNVTHFLPPKESKELMQKNQLRPKVLRPVKSIGSTIFLLCVGLLVVLISKDSIKKITAQMVDRPWFDGFVGFLSIIGIPIVIILFAITIIGIPLAILLGIAFGLVLLLSRIYVSYIVGAKILRNASPYWQVVVGILAVEILSHIPIVGFFISCIAALWGVGGIIMGFVKRKTTK